MSDSIASPSKQEARAFTVASSNPLKQPHILHPQSCNPAMDLAVLLCEPSDETDITLKGKNKASGVSTIVSLWRLGGATVWEVEVNGRVLGLTWSSDGLILSLLVLRLDVWPPDHDILASKSTVEHLSVHDGQVIKSIRGPQVLLDNVTAPDWQPASERHPHFAWWPMEWVGTAAQWPAHKPGAPLMVIDSLPDVTPVEPPKPAIINPFAIPNPADEKKKKGLHEKLDGSAALLGPSALVPPNVLSISEPRRGDGMPTASAHLLTGTYLLPSGVPDTLPSSVLELALRADTITRLLDTVFRGIESCAAAFRDADKQTFLWRDELEICGQQQAVSAPDVHADLFRFLMTGRPSVPVSEWLGNRLTNRPVSKWDTTVQTAFLTIQKVLGQSVIPALERVLLVLEELNGRAHDLIEFDVLLEADAIGRAMALSRGLLALCEEMRQAAALEWETAVEWFKWIRYEMNRAISSDDQATLPTHDLKLVWSFMVNGFVTSRFKLHFPNVFGATNDLLLEGIPAVSPPPATNLDAVLTATLASLSSRPDDVGASPAMPEPSFSASFASPVHPVRSPEEPPSSPSTVAHSAPGVSETPRDPAVEPWAWANTLLSACNGLVSAARLRDPAPPKSAAIIADSLPTSSFQDERVIDGARWILQLASPSTLCVLVHDEADAEVLRLARLSHPAATGRIIQAAWFGDEEMAVVLEQDGQRYLAMCGVEDIKEQLHALAWGPGVDLAWTASLESHALPLARTRALGHARRRVSADTWLLAVNSNPGRRSGWVLTQASEELVVFDLDSNEDADDDEDEEDEEDDEDDEDEVEEDIGIE